MSLRDDALGTLQNWTAPGATQDALRRRFTDHLRHHPDGVYRSCVPDHLTASCLVVDAAANQVLLTLHAKAGRWFQFGGHLEYTDTTLRGAATREAREESGLATLETFRDPLQLSEHEVPFCGETGRVHHLDVRYLAVAPVGGDHAVSDESLDVAWWPADALPDPEPELVDLVALARARLR